jgi:hypothetical protein
MPVKNFKRCFSNYFGIGIDARVGYTFDKYRTKNVFTNLICFACIGLAKLFKSSRKMEDLIETMEYESITEPVNIINSQVS